MRMFKFSSLFVLSFLFMWMFMPQLSAKHHSHKHRSSSFSFNLNLGNPYLYGAVYRPAYVERTTVVRPIVRPVVEERVYYPCPAPAYREIIIKRPYVEKVYMYPQASYYSSWGWGM